MIEIIYSQKWKQERIKSGPLYPYYESFIRSLVAKGYTVEKIRPRIAIINFLNEYLRQKKIAPKRVSQPTIEQFCKETSPSGRSADSQGMVFLSLFVNHLGEHGVIAKYDKRRKYVKTPLDILLDEFGEYLKRMRDITDDCIRRQKQHSRNFLKFIDESDLEKITGTTVQDFMMRTSEARSISYSKYEASSLRAFFKFLFVTQRVDRDLSLSIMKVANWEGTKIPETLSRQEVIKILESIDRSTDIGKRSYMIVMLLAKYGLRANEVIKLRLDDICWDTSRIRITSSKTNKIISFPLNADVGTAIFDYIKNARPQSKNRYLVLTCTEPYKNLARSASIVQTVSNAFKNAGIKSGKRVSHRFRYTVASRVLNNEGELQDVMKILGHNHLDTSAIYTKLDHRRLRKIAKVWPIDGAHLCLI